MSTVITALILIAGATVFFGLGFLVGILEGRDMVMDKQIAEKEEG